MTDESLTLSHFSFDVDADGVATVLMDLQDEKVNKIASRLEKDLQAVMTRIESDASIVAVVLGSKKKDNFLAGADIEEIRSVKTATEAAQLSAKLQSTLERLEAIHKEAGKPVVAAIHGSCMGGGTELALACSMRIASNASTTIMALPEVMLGLFPGAGGTQRLPRLIGVANALDIILTGRNIRPRKALALGLVDEVVPAAILLKVAQQRALDTAQGKTKAPARGLARLKELAQGAPESLQQLALEENPVGQRMLFKKAKEKLLKKTRGNYPGPERALEVVRIGTQEGIAAGYSAEADRFGQLAVSSEARALMSIFFATQEMKKENGTDNADIRPKAVHRVGLLGGGLMGGGVAAVSIMKAGLPVRIHEADNAGVVRGLRYVRKLLDKDVKRKRRSRTDADRLMTFLTPTLELSGFAGVNVVIEAVYEDLELKQRMLRQCEEVCREDTIFASNTSSLPIAKIAEASKRPETVLGMHYFSPVEKMPLLEIIVTPQTADWATATCVQLGHQQGKTVIVVRDGTGFYTSRILAPLMNEAAWILVEGAAVEQVDEAMMDWGFPVGPITLLDEVGIDVAAKVASIMQEAFGERMSAPDALTKLTESNRQGRKNGRGFFLYKEGKKGAVDVSVYDLLGQDAKRKTLVVDELQQRIGLQMVNEAARCLEEEILRSPRDGDIGAIFGLGFPPFTGGPFRYIDAVGAGEIVRRLERFADIHGARFEPAQILRDYANAGKRFRSERG